jgi:hypothetical protein
VRSAKSTQPTYALRGYLRGAVGILIALAACGGQLPHPPYIPQPSEALTEVDAAPPPPRVEYIPGQPNVPGAVWLDGEWLQKRGRWAWKLGRWVVPPEGAKFAPWAFVRSADGTLYFASGVFRNASGKAVADPPPLAVARAGSATVLLYDGDVAVTGRTIRAQVAKPPEPAANQDGRSIGADPSHPAIGPLPPQPPPPRPL